MKGFGLTLRGKGRITWKIPPHGVIIIQKTDNSSHGNGYPTIRHCISAHPSAARPSTPTPCATLLHLFFVTPLSKLAFADRNTPLDHPDGYCVLHSHSLPHFCFFLRASLSASDRTRRALTACKDGDAGLERKTMVFCKKGMSAACSVVVVAPRVMGMRVCV